MPISSVPMAEIQWDRTWGENGSANAGGDTFWDDEATVRGRAPRTVTGFPSSHSQSGKRAGNDVFRDDEATVRGRAPRRRAPRFPTSLAPGQGCGQETLSTKMTGRRHEAGHHG